MKQFNSVTKYMTQLLTGLLLSFCMLTQVQAAGDQNSITGMNVISSGGGATVIKIELAKPLDNVPVGFTINTPPRIALDFPNTANGLGKSVQDFNEGDLRNANIVQAGNRTRLVINLNQMLAYDTKIDGNSLLVTLQGKAADQAAGTALRFAETKQDAQKHSLRDIDFRRGKTGEGRIQVDLSDAGIGIDIRQQGTVLIVDFIKAKLPRNLQRKLDVVDFATPVQNVDTYVQGDNVRMVIEPKGLWEHAAYQTDNKFIVEIKPIIEDPNKLVKGSQIGYAGEKLTLNFQKIDVREALNVIADFTELNMVISDTVSGNLTLRLKDVPWDQALDIILDSRGLDMRKNGNVIQVAPREEIAAKEKINLTAKQEISDLEELRTESFQLSYQKGDDVKKMLADFSAGNTGATGRRQSILSGRGSVVVDARTNTLFIQDTPSSLEGVRKLIKQIDVPVRQVMIEARIVEASDKFGKQLGVRMGYNATNDFKVLGDLRGQTGANILPATSPLGAAGFTPNISTPNVNLPVTGAAGAFSLMLFNSGLTKMLSLELSALETDNKGKIISSPRVVTSDNVKATIKQGVKIPYQQASSSGATTTAWEEATLKLEVTPQITPDDNVMMKLNTTKNAETGRASNNAPIMSINEVDTQVLVENGGTVVIGGVYEQNDTTTISKVPLLGDVPVLGVLFKKTVRQDDKSELLIFITPKIMKDTLNLR